MVRSSLGRSLMLVIPFACLASMMLLLSNSGDLRAQPGERGTQKKNILLHDYCDGLSVTIRNGSVSGKRTCCVRGRVSGQTFNKINGSGWYVLNSDGTFEWDVYETGTYAGNWYGFTLPDGTLSSQGTWEAVADGVCPSRGAPSDQ